MPRRVVFEVASLTLLAAVPGCASVDVLRVTSANQPGIRYWRPAPFIALAPSTNSGVTTCEAKLVMLPDKTQEFAITMQAGIGTAEADPTLEGGWNLTGLTGKADSKVAENIGALANLVGNAAKVGFLSASPAQGTPDQAQQSILRNCKGLLKIVYDPVTREIVAFKPMSLHVDFALRPSDATGVPKAPGAGAGAKKLTEVSPTEGILPGGSSLAIPGRDGAGAIGSTRDQPGPSDGAVRGDGPVRRRRCRPSAGTTHPASTPAAMPRRAYHPPTRTRSRGRWRPLFLPGVGTRPLPASSDHVGRCRSSPHTGARTKARR